jgi:HEAT repeat protein
MTDELDDVLARLATAEDPNVRRNAAWLLGRHRDLSLIPALIDATGDADPGVRLRAIEALGNYDDDAAIRPLTLALADARADIRREAIRALGNRRATAAVAPLLALEAATSTSSERIACVLALSAIGAQHHDWRPAITPALLAILGDDPDADAQYAAARGLGKLSDASAIQPLIGLLARSQGSRAVRIIEALVELWATEAIPDLQALTTSEDAEVSATAAWAVARIGGGNTS